MEGDPVNPPDRRHGWWSGLSGGTKAFISALAGGLTLAVVTGPLGPVLTDLGAWINPFERGRHDLRVAVTSIRQSHQAGWIIPKPSAQIASPLGKDGRWDDWIQHEGGVRAETMSLEVSLQGATEKAVLITGMGVEVTDRRPPLAGTHVVVDPGAGAVDSRYFSILLGDPPTIALVAPPSGSPPDISDAGRPVGFPYSVSQSEFEYFTIYVHAGACDCEWIGRLHWVVDGTQGETVIDDDGEPFRITSTANAHTTALYRSGDPTPTLIPD